jgi:hypothetical protein
MAACADVDARTETSIAVTSDASLGAGIRASPKRTRFLVAERLEEHALEEQSVSAARALAVAGR